MCLLWAHLGKDEVKTQEDEDKSTMTRHIDPGRQGESFLLLCLEGVPDLPVAPQDEAGLTKTFQTWPRGWFHIP